MNYTEMLNTVLLFTKVGLLVLNLCMFIAIVYMQKRKYSRDTVNLFFPTNNKTTEEQTPQPQQQRRIGIVIAHPDDEAMFMTPTIKSLTEQMDDKKSDDQIQVFLLCLSTGNADGLGDSRMKELYESSRNLGILRVDQQGTLVHSVSEDWPATARVIIVDHPDLQDGMKKRWNHDLIKQFVQKFSTVNRIDTLLTFDEHGISSHPNHIDTHRGVCLLANGTTTIYTLATCNLLRKYIGVLDFLLALVMDKKQESDVVLFTPGWKDAYNAMKAHGSQFVWFRRLFILFSRYAYVNAWNRFAS